MRNTFPSLLVLAVACGLAAPATAAPVATSAALSISIQGAIQGEGSIGDLPPISLVGGGVVSVSGTTISVPAGLITQVGSLTIPVTGTSAVNSLIATGIANLAGTFSVGGVTAQAPAEVCPGGGPAAGQACNVGGGVGGVMALTGVIQLHVIPHIVVIPTSLNHLLIGQGGTKGPPFAFTVDAAAWSTGTGLVNTGSGMLGLAGDDVPLTLVSPTFLLTLGDLLLPTFATFLIGEPPLVPEPAAAAMITAGLCGLALLARARRRR